MFIRPEPSHRLARRPAIVLATVVAATLAACTPAVTDADHAVYPRFSLVGELPQRVTELELTIDAPDMTTVSTTIAADDGPHVVEIPRGENRLIELLAVDDVYSGSVTADFPDAGEYEVTVPMTPGPVIPDYGNERLVQIRDMSGAGRREFGADADIDLADFSPTDVAYDDNGNLWVADGGENGGTYGLLRIDDLSAESGVEGFMEGADVDALAVDSERRRVYLWGEWDPGVGLYYLDMEAEEVSEDLVVLHGQLAQQIIEADGESRVFGLDIDNDGTIIAALNIFNLDDFEDFNALWVVRIDPDATEDVVTDSLGPGELGWDTFVPESRLDVVRDVLMLDDYVYATMAVDIDADYDEMVRFVTDFDPDSVEAVTLDNGGFLGPQRFVRQRGDGDRILVTDWDGQAANARVVAFDGHDPDSWHIYVDSGDLFVFFELLGPLII